MTFSKNFFFCREEKKTKNTTSKKTTKNTQKIGKFNTIILLHLKWSKGKDFFLFVANEIYHNFGNV